MNLLNLFRRNRRETRAETFTDQVIAARFDAMTGRSGIGELTGTVQTCVSLWESGLSLAEVTGTDALTPRTLALMARSLGLKGEALFLVRDEGLIPASQWDVRTRDGQPRGYRVTIPDTGGGRTVTALAGEVIHVAVGSNTATPWHGSPPLHRASMTAGLLHALETALQEVYESAPLGSQITPMPENPEVDNDALARSFRGQRGRVLLRESVNVSAAGGPTPVTDWKPSDLSPDLARSMTAESLTAARQAILSVYGVLPSLMDPAAAGPSVREGQRHLAQWQLQPLAALIAEEATAKLAAPVTLDVLQPTQAYDAGGRARALNGAVEAMSKAKEAGLSEEEVAAAARFAGVPQA